MTPDELCDQYLDQVYRFAALVSRDRQNAEDLAQEAMMRAVRALPNFAPDRGAPEGWLWRIVVNAARDLGRVRRRQLLTFERFLAATGDQRELSADVLLTLHDDELIAAVRSLPRQARAVIALRYGADLDFTAVASNLGITAGGARAACSRGLALLRQRLGSQASECPGVRVATEPTQKEPS